jgi:glycyl-tRNA synthetase
MSNSETTRPSQRLSLDEIISFCRRRGFIFQASEIYGGINGFWDFGPLGVELKRNIKDAWWRDMVTTHNPLVVLPGAPSKFEMVGIDTSIIQHPQIWRVSGHADLFSDLMVDCRESKRRYRYDHIVGRWLHRSNERIFVCAAPDAPEPQAYLDDRVRKVFGQSRAAPILWESELIPLPKLDELEKVLGPHASKAGTFTDPREFNLMFETHVGAVQGEAGLAYLRPETAQGIFTNFRNVLDTGRHALPLGVAQVGKSFRNEITPRHFIFRSREFEQMEMEFFCEPETSMAWYQFWRQRRLEWYQKLGLSAERLRIREHSASELSHYALGTADIEYAYPFLIEGEFGELEGIANRGDFDLTSHSLGRLESAAPPRLAVDDLGQPRHRGSGKNLAYWDVAGGRKYVPHVIEPAAGVERALVAFLSEALQVETAGGSGEVSRTVLRLHPRLAPVKVAVYPLVKKDGMPEIARELFGALKRRFNAVYDEKDSIGRRYRRADEIGIPICITIDSISLVEPTVTIRYRDNLEQTRVRIEDCEKILDQILSA